jgi:hypothetical protein
MRERLCDLIVESEVDLKEACWIFLNPCADVLFSDYFAVKTSISNGQNSFSRLALVIALAGFGCLLSFNPARSQQLTIMSRSIEGSLISIDFVPRARREGLHVLVDLTESKVEYPVLSFL